MKRRTCPYCRGKKIPTAYTRSDGNVVLRCSLCDLLFLREWPEDVVKLYQDDYFDKAQRAGEAQPEVGYSVYAELGPYEFRWQQAMLRLFAGRPGVRSPREQKAPALLDVGCANGSFLGLAREDGYATEGIELLDVAAAQARQRGLLVHSQPFEKVGEPGQFEVVTAWEFIEHVADLRATFSKVHSLLTDDGVFLFSTPDAGAEEVMAQGDSWIGYRSSLEHLTFLNQRFLDRSLTEIFGHPPLLVSFVYRSGADTYSTLIGVARKGGLRPEERRLGELIVARQGTQASDSLTELSWLYVQFQQLLHEQIDPQGVLPASESAALRGWAHYLAGDLQRAIPELVTGAQTHRDLWQTVAVARQRQHVLDEAEHKLILDSQSAHYKQQIAELSQSLQHMQQQWQTALDSMTWKIGRGITSRVEKVPLSQELLTAAQVLRSDGVSGLVAASLQSARQRVVTHLPGLPQLPRLAPLLWERASHAGATFVFLPSVEWHLTLFQRPQHLARALAQLGYVVIYDETNLGQARTHQADDSAGFQEIEPNLFLFRGDPRLLTELPRLILWSFTYNFHLKDSFAKDVRVIYDWIDDLKVFPHDQKFLAAAHARAMTESQVVLSVARVLDVEAKQQRPDAIYLPNGVEFDRFAATDLPMPADEAFARICAEGKPIAGYYGALASWFDYDLLRTVAERRPDWNFVLIGVRFDDSLSKTSMLKCKNIHYLGPRPYSSLPGYLSRFDVATIPFLINEITLATSPLKLYEYFAGGRATLTTPMPECMAYEEVLIARTADEFADKLDLARQQGQDPAFRAHVQKLARENTWQARAQQAVSAILAIPETAEQKESPPAESSLSRRFYLGLYSGINAVDDNRVRLRRWLQKKRGAERILTRGDDHVAH